MKKKKNSKWPVLVALSGLAVLLCVLTGRRYRDVYLRDFSVSDDGETLILDVGVRGKDGCVRAATLSGDGESVHVSFYSAYGVHAGMGAEHIFPLHLPKACTRLYFGSADAWVLTLEKRDGVWERV